jgi:hypothetical protein
MKTQVNNYGEWENDFHPALEQTIADPNGTLQDLIEVVFQKGILDQLCPLNKETRMRWLELGYQIWRGSRRDPELYYRIFYSAQGCIDYFEQYLSGGFAGYMIALDEAHKQAMAHLDKYPELKDAKNTSTFMLEKIMQRCMIELANLRRKCPKRFFAKGDKGLYRGMRVIISGISRMEGTIFFKTDEGFGLDQALTDEFKIREANGGCQASPYEMHRGAFAHAV